MLDAKYQTVIKWWRCGRKGMEDGGFDLSRQLLGASLHKTSSSVAQQRGGITDPFGLWFCYVCILK